MKQMMGMMALVVVLGAWGPCTEPDAGCLHYCGTTCCVAGHSASEHHGATCLERHAQLKPRSKEAPTLEDSQLIAARECMKWFPADGKERPEATVYRASLERQCVGVPAARLYSTSDSDYWY